MLDAAVPSTLLRAGVVGEEKLAAGMGDLLGEGVLPLVCDGCGDLRNVLGRGLVVGVVFGKLPVLLIPSLYTILLGVRL
jgi:hypothetical protein